MRQDRSVIERSDLALLWLLGSEVYLSSGSIFSATVATCNFSAGMFILPNLRAVQALGWWSEVEFGEYIGLEYTVLLLVSNIVSILRQGYIGAYYKCLTISLRMGSLQPTY